MGAPFLLTDTNGLKCMYEARKDISLLTVVISNAISIVMAYIYDWSLHEVMWIYLGQNLVIGAVNVLRILSLKEYKTSRSDEKTQHVSSALMPKTTAALFFAVHYGFFHVVYASFIWAEKPLISFNDATLGLMAVCVVGFLASHILSLRHNIGRDFKDQAPKIATVMMYPYARIIPMHLTIILGAFLASESWTLLLFMVLKSVADIKMHMKEHELFQKTGSKAL